MQRLQQYRDQLIGSKAGALGNDQFKAMIEQKLAQAASPKSRGGDRKSSKYRQSSRSIESDPDLSHDLGLSLGMNSFLGFIAHT